MTDLAEKTALRRHPERRLKEREALYAILDEALVAHIGFVSDGVPVVIPATYGRSGETLYLHGAAGGRLLETLARGVDICVTVTLLDGIVLARSTFNHSMNYRSVVAFGRARLVKDADEVRAALECVVEHVVPGRTRELRDSNAKELAATTVVALTLDAASAKMRSGPPKDGDGDDPAGPWSGVIGAHLTFEPPLSDERSQQLSPPPSARNYARPRPDSA